MLTPTDRKGLQLVSLVTSGGDPKERREVATRFAASEEFRRRGIARLEGRRVRIDTREPRRDPTVRPRRRRPGTFCTWTTTASCAA
jgi:hypothetical protein